MKILKLTQIETESSWLSNSPIPISNATFFTRMATHVISFFFLFYFPHLYLLGISLSSMKYSIFSFISSINSEAYSGHLESYSSSWTNCNSMERLASNLLKSWSFRMVPGLMPFPSKFFFTLSWSLWFLFRMVR